ncbi:hypothetical protein DSL72_002279 [Monilinia vaccinii-corymbosi]|uniref:Uncharacterized protein n=1 Tax=Monilinia vaccinii-corymbosi TaxID=61207 RepID=A0A8A3PC65_9HELO|nr:hypothetical protein DSL72_002279 [Monilinia vaccinii-corymbosi]
MTNGSIAHRNITNESRSIEVGLTEEDKNGKDMKVGTSNTNRTLEKIVLGTKITKGKHSVSRVQNGAEECPDQYLQQELVVTTNASIRIRELQSCLTGASQAIPKSSSQSIVSTL